MLSRIPVASTDLTGNEEAYAVDAIRSSWISSSGKYLDRFESEFAPLCSSEYALGVANGTVALHLALLGMNIRPGDEVLIPSLTYVATANAVRYVGGEPVFVDVDPETWCIDPNKLEAAITRRTCGIIAVHLLGHPADMDRINQFAGLHGLWVVEDAAEAPFAQYKDRVVGSLSDASTFSFFGNKMITCGEGGAVVVNDEKLYSRLKALRGQGMDPNRRYYFPITGYNFRLTNLAASILCAQLERTESIVRDRLAIFHRYNEALGAIEGIELQPVQHWAKLSPWMYACIIDEKRFGCGRDVLMSKLAERQIETRPMFVPLHTLPPFREESQARREYLPETDRLAAGGIMLPTFTNLTVADQIRVIEDIRQISRQAKDNGVRRAA